MAFPSTEELRAYIEPVATAHGMDVEDVRAVKAGKKSQVIVALDSDTRPTLDELEVVSQELSELFDATEDAGKLNFGAGYTLEVTTPGVDLPLTQPRHWRRNRGRLAVIEGKAWRIGALRDDESEIILVEAGTKTPKVAVRAVSDLPAAVVDIEFNQPPAAEVELAELSFDEALKLEAGER
ncbi:ribosome maturation factor RimP [Corynebacterium aquatimens]|uniref:ribosome maturation factor RimP n=1 Tax=Corynebacterium TaxID=1716 RepID=UPI001F31127E|nr:MULTISPECIES: ribosome maturation factor RimP [Corynebacterium]QYH19571.1 ribosome maturation factor RimP [Corynebacterium aquatimens]UIZ91464.1 ribosome maturation factor RimP [Corynebacterium sp. CNCTC7651]